MIEIIKKQPTPDEMTLTLIGQLNFMVRKDFQAALKNISSEGVEQIILDLTQVSSIDCTALGILIKAKQELGETQIRLSLLTSPGRVFEILKTLDLEKMFPLRLIQQEI